MALSKKHYEQFAYRFQRQLIAITERVETSPASNDPRYEGAYGSLRELAAAMCVDFALDNPRFDRQRFLDACGF